MEPTQYFDDYSSNIDSKSEEEIRKECYKQFMTNLDIVYAIARGMPQDIQLEALINMIREI